MYVCMLARSLCLKNWSQGQVNHTYQMSYKDLGAVLDSKVEGSVVRRVLNLGINASIHAKQEDEWLNVIVEHSQMKKVLATAVNLEQAKHHTTKEIIKTKNTNQAY